MPKAINQATVKPLNQRTVHSAVNGALQYIQDEKIQIARRTITREQYAGRWPEKYISFVTSEADSGRYRDPEKFFRIMHFKPEWYARKFIFRPLFDSANQIREAVIMAFDICIRQTQRYIAAPNVSGKPNKSSGAYASHFQIMINNVPIASPAELDKLSSDTVVEIVNVAPYAATSEANALYHAKTYGIIYYAAQIVSRQFPKLGVAYVYSKANFIPGTIARYDVPTLKIGTRDNVIDKLRKPGYRIRRRQRAAAHTARLRNKRRR